MNIQFHAPLPTDIHFKGTKFTSLRLVLVATLGFALSSCTTADLSKFGESTMVLSEASISSQQGIAETAEVVANLLVELEPPPGSGAACDGSAGEISPKVCAEELEEQAKQLKGALVLVQAYSNAIGNLSQAAGTGEEAARGICNSIVTAVSAIGDDLDDSVCEGGTPNQSTGSTLIDIGANLAGAFTSHQGNKGLAVAMGEADEFIGELANELANLADSQAKIVRTLAKLQAADIVASGEAYNMISQDILAAKKRESGSFSEFISGFIEECRFDPDTLESTCQLPENLSSVCIDQTDSLDLKIKPEMYYISRNLFQKQLGSSGEAVGKADAALGVVVDNSVCPGGVVVDVPKFLKGVTQLEAARIEELDELDALRDHEAAEERAAQIAAVAKRKRDQLAQIEAIPRIAVAWRSAHSQALAHAQTCKKFKATFKKKCGALTFENLQLLGKALSFVGGPYTKLPELLGSFKK